MLCCYCVPLLLISVSIPIPLLILFFYSPKINPLFDVTSVPLLSLAPLVWALLLFPTMIVPLDVVLLSSVLNSYFVAAIAFNSRSVLLFALLLIVLFMLTLAPCVMGVVWDCFTPVLFLSPTTNSPFCFTGFSTVCFDIRNGFANICVLLLFKVSGCVGVVLSDIFMD